MTDVDQKDKPTNYSETTDSVFKTASKLWFRSRSPFKSWSEYLELTRSLWKASKYQSVNNLQDSLRRRGQTISYRNSICREVYHLCILTGKTPEELSSWPRDHIEKQIQRIVDQHLESPNYARTKFYLLKAFFKANGFEYEKDLKVQLPKPIPYSSKKRSPMVRVEDVVKMAESKGTSPRDSAIINLQRCGGFRASDVTAIRFGRGDPNLPKSSIKEQILERRKNLLIAICPEMKEINPSACKNNTPYYGFTDETGTKAIIDFLIWRIDKYGFIPDDAPLFETEYNQISLQKRNITRLSSREICLIDKKAAIRARIEEARKITAKSLRMLFRQLLRNQRPENQIDYDDKEFLMGHRLGKTQQSYFNIYDTDRLRAKFAKLDLMHSPIFEGEQKEKENDQVLRISEDFESAYTELIEKIKAMENAKQKRLFNLTDPYPTRVELGDEKLQNSTIEGKTQSLERKARRSLLDYFHTNN